MWVRILSALALFPPVLLCIFAGEHWYKMLVLVITVLMAFEWNALTSEKPVRFVKIPGWIWHIIGAVYISAAAFSLLYLRNLEEEGFAFAMYVACTVWATDIGAYFTGKALQGPKLCPTISAGKTWTGLVGGVICAGMIGASIQMITELNLFHSPFVAATWSATAAVVAQTGDLAESWVKRVFGKKDSGRLIPGHGGVLDRMDGMNAAAMFFALAHAFDAAR